MKTDLFRYVFPPHPQLVADAAHELYKIFRLSLSILSSPHVIEKNIRKRETIAKMITALFLNFSAFFPISAIRIHSKKEENSSLKLKFSRPENSVLE